MIAASSKAGTSIAPLARGVPCMMTGPSFVRKRLWQDGNDHTLRVTPAFRRTSAKYGKPPTWGRPACATFRASVRLSIAWLTRFLLIRLGYRGCGYDLQVWQAVPGECSSLLHSDNRSSVHRFGQQSQQERGGCAVPPV